MKPFKTVREAVANRCALRFGLPYEMTLQLLDYAEAEKPKLMRDGIPRHEVVTEDPCVLLARRRVREALERTPRTAHGKRAADGLKVDGVAELIMFALQNGPKTRKYLLNMGIGKPKSLSNFLTWLVEEGRIERLSRGLYALPQS